MKLDVDELDTDKLEAVPNDLNKLSNAVDNNIVRKTVYDELVEKGNAIDATDNNDLNKAKIYRDQGKNSWSW